MIAPEENHLAKSGSRAPVASAAVLMPYFSWNVWHLLRGTTFRRAKIASREAAEKRDAWFQGDEQVILQGKPPCQAPRAVSNHVCRRAYVLLL